MPRDARKVHRDVWRVILVYPPLYGFLCKIVSASLPSLLLLREREVGARDGGRSSSSAAVANLASAREAPFVKVQSSRRETVCWVQGRWCFTVVALRRWTRTDNRNGLD